MNTIGLTLLATVQNLMANCPNCGSSHISLTKETNVNWGRAVAGWALFGVVGGAVGAVTGEDRNVNVCLDCGTPWKAADLHKILQIIATSTGITLDLSSEADRFYMSRFVEQVGSYVKAIFDAEEKGKNLITAIQNKSAENAAGGCAFGCGASLLCVFTAISVLSAGGFFLIVIGFPLGGLGIGLLMDKANKKTIEREVEAAKAEAQKMKDEAKKNFKFAVRKFMNKYAL